MGSSDSRTMTATAHATALSQAHGMIKTEAPKRSSNIRNVTQSKTGSWPIPEEMTRQVNEVLKLHFMPAINSILEHENIKNNDDLEILSKETATVVTILVPTNTTSTHCATRLITTTLLVPIANQESNISVIEENNKLYQKNGNKDKYLFLPHDSVLSKHNLKSNTDTYLVKRLCWADQSIIANSSQSEDPLLQTITITSSSNISISERCPNKNSWQGTPRLLVSVLSRWSLVLLGVRDQVSVPVSLTLKKRDRTRYRYRSPKKIETGLGLGIVNFKKTRPESVSVSFT